MHQRLGHWLYVMRKFWKFSRERSYAAFLVGSKRMDLEEEDLTFRTLQNLKQPDIVKFVKLQTLKWAGHLARMNEDRYCKKIFLAKPKGNRPRDRPPLRWIDCVEKDLNI
ncbi:hypothetical protein TNCV_1344351 [Trichonephila clavipes]|nr:hypothetical protein TNCV_1344351 [Trichonephila clavipes]